MRVKRVSPHMGTPSSLLLLYSPVNRRGVAGTVSPCRAIVITDSHPGLLYLRGKTFGAMSAFSPEKALAEFSAARLNDRCRTGG